MAVDREASALRTVVLLATSFPGEPETQIRSLVRRHIDEAVSAEWPAMAKGAASLKVAPPALAELLRLALSLTPQSQGQIVAQREIVAALENAMEARRERINLSQSTVNWVKWTCMFGQAVCALVAIAMVQSDNRATAAIAMGIFATGVAVCALLITSHDRPFTGEISVKPDVLLQVRPDSSDVGSP
jgi:K+-sensing histidine kinase KdpD